MATMALLVLLLPLTITVAIATIAVSDNEAMLSFQTNGRMGLGLLLVGLLQLDFLFITTSIFWTVCRFRQKH